MEIKFTKIQNGWFVVVKSSNQERVALSEDPMFFATLTEAMEWVRETIVHIKP